MQDHAQEECFYFSPTKTQSPPSHRLCPLFVLLRSAPRKHLPLFSLTTRVAVEGNNEISLLQGIWIQVSLGASGVLQALHHNSGLLLDSLQFPSVFSELGSPELDTVLE